MQSAMRSEGDASAEAPLMMSTTKRQLLLRDFLPDRGNNMEGPAKGRINIQGRRVRAGLAAPRPTFHSGRTHAHHILEANGRPGEYRAWVREGQDILRAHGVDPFYGSENLVWAPNRGHTLAEQKSLVLELRATNGLGGTREDIVEILRGFGERAANR